MSAITSDRPAAERLRIADILTTAADIIDRVGLHQGALHHPVAHAQGIPPGDICQCAMGALATAVSGQPSAKALYRAGTADLWDAAVQAVEDHGTPGLGPGCLAAWNDAPGRTALEVSSVFRDTARALRQDGGLP